MGSTSAFSICLVLSLAMPRIQVASFGSLYGWLGPLCNLGGIQVVPFVGSEDEINLFSNAGDQSSKGLKTKKLV